jgi:hypothetical protein
MLYVAVYIAKTGVQNFKNQFKIFALIVRGCSLFADEQTSSDSEHRILRATNSMNQSSKADSFTSSSFKFSL